MMPVDLRQNLLNSWILHQAYSLWSEQPWRNIAPDANGLNRESLGPLLQHSVLLDVEHDPLDFVVDHFGANIRTFTRRDETGSRFSTDPAKGPQSMFWRTCAQVVESHQPLDVEIPYEGNLWDFYKLRQLILPLTTDGRKVDRLLFATHFMPVSQ
jgi:hypothetical protein